MRHHCFGARTVRWTVRWFDIFILMSPRPKAFVATETVAGAQGLARRRGGGGVAEAKAEAHPPRLSVLQTGHRAITPNEDWNDTVLAVSEVAPAWRGSAALGGASRGFARAGETVAEGALPAAGCCGPFHVVDWHRAPPEGHPVGSAPPAAGPRCAVPMPCRRAARPARPARPLKLCRAHAPH